MLAIDFPEMCGLPMIMLNTERRVGGGGYEKHILICSEQMLFCMLSTCSTDNMRLCDHVVVHILH